MKYHVREARRSDIAKLTELRVKQLEALGNRVRAWVAELDGEVIGCAFVDVNHGMPRPSNPSGVYGELLGAYILRSTATAPSGLSLSQTWWLTYAEVSSATSRWTWTSAKRASSAGSDLAVTDVSCACATTGKALRYNR